MIVALLLLMAGSSRSSAAFSSSMPRCSGCGSSRPRDPRSVGYALLAVASIVLGALAMSTPIATA